MLWEEFLGFCGGVFGPLQETRGQVMMQAPAVTFPGQFYFVHLLFYISSLHLRLFEKLFDIIFQREVELLIL